MYKAKLSIKETTWSGFAVKTGDAPSQVKDPYTIEVQNEQEITLQYANTKYLIQVSDTNETSVGLHSKNLSVKNQGYGYSLRPKPTDITLQIDQTEIFHTPTMDAGAKWEIKLLSINPLELNKDETTSLHAKDAEKRLPPKIGLPIMYFKETQSLLALLENKLQTKIICYCLDPSAMIRQSHVDIFIDQLKNIGSVEKLSLIIIGGGGDAYAAIRIATLIKEYCKTFEVIVPTDCPSASTILALAGDRILMTPSACLTPIDGALAPETITQDGSPKYIFFNQLKHLLQVLKSENSEMRSNDKEGPYMTLFKYINPLLLAEIERRSTGDELIAIKMMKMHSQSFKNEEEIMSIAKHLVNDYPEHYYSILYNEAKEMGLPVDKVDKEISHILQSLVKFYGVITKEVNTTFNANLYHAEGYPVIIESQGLRIARRNSFNRCLNTITKVWGTIDDHSGWVHIKPTNIAGKDYEITPLEAEETNEYQIPIKEKEPDQLDQPLEDPTKS